MEQFQKSENNNIASDYVLLHPNFIVEAVSYLMRNESKLLEKSSMAVDNVPRISRKGLKSLWKSHPKLFKSINTTSATSTCPFQFIEKILIQQKMLIPIATPSSREPFSLMVPSLLESVEPGDDFFSYKPNRASVMTLCHSWVFSDQVIPIGFMENMMASIYSAVYTHKKYQHWKVEEVMFWKKALFIQCSNVKLFIRLTDQSSPFCVASNSMSPGTKRLTVSGQGSSLLKGKFIWEEGFGFILNIIQQVMKGYNALKCEEQIICPKCLKHHPIAEAHAWSRAAVYDKVTNPESRLLCQKAHAVNVSSLTGIKCIQEKKKNPVNEISKNMVRFEDVLGGIVLIGVYDESNQHNKRLLYAGSGFIVDKKRGLIVTAAHTLFETERGRIGERKGDKIFIGVVPKNHGGNGYQPAVFRYVANIVAQDSSMEGLGICQVDACVLKIVAKNKWDVVDSHGISNVYQEKMTSKDIKKENLVELKVRENCEIEEHVRVLGFSQSGQNIVEEGTCLFRNVGCTPGVVVSRDEYDSKLGDGGFCPNKEIRVLCDTYCGESGGPCINQQGEVIGILSRSHPTMSYLVPSSEWLTQVKRVQLKKKRKHNILTL